MKKIILGLLILVSFCVKAQNSLIYTKIIQVDSINKNAIYTEINDWFTTYYKSSKNVIQMSDKDEGIIVGKALFYYSYYCNMQYNIKVYIKDGKCKIETRDFILNCIDPYSNTSELITTDSIPKQLGLFPKQNIKRWNEKKEKCNEETNLIFNSIENKLNELKKRGKNDNW